MHGRWGHTIGVRPPRRLVEHFLDRLAAALREDRVLPTQDAIECAAHQFGWALGEIFGVLYDLDEDDCHLSEASTAPEGGVIWVFLPMTEEGRIWVRLCERDNILIISFHRG